MCKGHPFADQASRGQLSKHGWRRWVFPAAGFLSLVWFMARVLPKPSRAAYPCQRAAAPLAGGFVVWIAGTLGSATFYSAAKKCWSRARAVPSFLCMALVAILGTGAFLRAPQPVVLASTPEPNRPIGTAKGIFPGRVVWVYNPKATSWEGPGQGHWWDASNTSQAVVDSMMSAALRRLTGKTTDRLAWEALFRHFNQTRGNGNTGYRRGEKVMVKVNLVGCLFGEAVDPKTYDLTRNLDYMNTSPQMMVALLRQLVHAAGVNQEDISIGDTLALFPNQYYDICRKEFPKARYLDHDGGNASHPRTRIEPSSVQMYWSVRPTDKAPDFIPAPYVEAKYLINMANLKSHTSAGVTLCAKNHFGSLSRRPFDERYYDLHGSLPDVVPGPGHYRSLVDLMGNAHLGAKSVLFLIDALYPGVHPIEVSPRKWSSAPFNGRWTSSLFASQDPVAIDSVGFDFLWAEWSDYPHMSGADDYLREAALANNPPSGTFYDPNHPTNTTRLASLGVHEHWNNPADKQYSRNLGKDVGIELVQVHGGSQ